MPHIAKTWGLFNAVLSFENGSQQHADFGGRREGREGGGHGSAAPRGARTKGARAPRGPRPRGQEAHPPRREGRAGRWRQRGEGSGPAAPTSVKQEVESLPQEEGAAGAGVRSRPAPGQPRGTPASSRLSAPLGPCGRVHPGPESHHLTGLALRPAPRVTAA